MDSIFIRKQDDNVELLFISGETIQNFILQLGQITINLTEKLKDITQTKNFIFFIKVDFL